MIRFSDVEGKNISLNPKHVESVKQQATSVEIKMTTGESYFVTESFNSVVSNLNGERVTY